MTLKFIDLFAGIGGFHEAVKDLGWQCVFASEKDKHARETYLRNHTIKGDRINEDIRTVPPHLIPNHDVLFAGFPCQPFAQTGQKQGFEDHKDSERGNLFFCIRDILAAKRPKAFILENVRNLEKHDGGNTFKVIKKELESLGYELHHKIIKASEHGRPQHRPRIFIVGFNKQLVTNEKTSFKFPTPTPLLLNMSDVWGGNCDREIGFTLRVGGRNSGINDRHNWDAYRVDNEVKTLTAKEGRRMMGFPDDFWLPSGITQSMKQLGNSVCVDVVRELSKALGDTITNELSESHTESSNSTIRKVNFVCKIDGLLADFASINRLKNVEDRISAIKDQGGELSFSHLEQSVILNGDSDETFVGELFTYAKDIQTEIGSELEIQNEQLLDYLIEAYDLPQNHRISLLKGDMVSDRFGSIYEENNKLLFKLHITIKAFC